MIGGRTNALSESLVRRGSGDGGLVSDLRPSKSMRISGELRTASSEDTTLVELESLKSSLGSHFDKKLIMAIGQLTRRIDEGKVCKMLWMKLRMMKCSFEQGGFMDLKEALKRVDWVGHAGRVVP